MVGRSVLMSRLKRDDRGLQRLVMCHRLFLSTPICLRKAEVDVAEAETAEKQKVESINAFGSESYENVLFPCA